MDGAASFWLVVGWLLINNRNKNSLRTGLWLISAPPCFTVWSEIFQPLFSQHRNNMMLTSRTHFSLLYLNKTLKYVSENILSWEKYRMVVHVSSALPCFTVLSECFLLLLQLLLLQYRKQHCSIVQFMIFFCISPHSIWEGERGVTLWIWLYCLYLAHLQKAEQPVVNMTTLPETK